MPGFDPVDPKQSFPELEERVLARWREEDVFAPLAGATRERAEVWSFYEGPPTANGRPGSHHVLARVFKDVYPRYKTMCGYRVPRKAGWDCHGLPVELEVEKQLGISSKQEIEEFGIAEFNQRCRESVFEYVEELEPADRADRLLDRPRRPLRHPRGRLHRVGLVVAEAALGQGAPLRGPQGRPLLPPLRHPALLARGCAGLQGRRGPLDLRPLPAAWRGRRRVGRVAAGLDDDALDPARQRRRRGRPRVTYVRAEVDGEILILAEPLVEKVLGEGAKIVDRFPRLGPRRSHVPRAGLRSEDREPADAFPVARRRFRHHRGRHRPRPHRPGLRRGRLRGRRRQRHLRSRHDARHPLQPGRARRHLRRPRVRASRAGSSRTRR